MNNLNWSSVSKHLNVVLLIALVLLSVGFASAVAQHDRECRSDWEALGGALNGVAWALDEAGHYEFMISSQATSVSFTALRECERSAQESEFKSKLQSLVDLGMFTSVGLWEDSMGRAELASGFYDIGYRLMNEDAPAGSFGQLMHLVDYMEGRGYNVR